MHRLLALTLLLSCSGGSDRPSAPAPAPVPAPKDPLDTFEATLRVDPEADAKRFQGVWLHRPDQPPLLAEYRALQVWLPLDGARVVVTGERWSPEPHAQQVDAPHFRIETLKLAEGPSPDIPLVSVGAERPLEGVMETLEGEPGTKRQGATWHAFTADGTTWQLWHTPPDLPLDTPLRVTARPVEVSPYAAHSPGPMLWIRSFERLDQDAGTTGSGPPSDGD